MNFKHLIYIISFFVPICALAHNGEYKPIEFVQNKGQWHGDFAYKATYGNIQLFLEDNTFTYKIEDPNNTDLFFKYKHGELKTCPKLPYHVYKVHMLNANSNPEIVGQKPQKHYYNYYLSNDPNTWKDHIYPELAVDYKNIYNNIDLHIASEGRNLKYDFIVHPNADANIIQLEFEGVDDIDIRNDNLVIKTSIGEIYEMAPYAYQYIDGERKKVPCKYKLKNNTLRYYFPKGYDKAVSLIIDPQIVFATFTGSTADNWGFTATYDNQGNFYGGGIVSGVGYPTTIGPSYTGGSTADSNGGVNPFLSDIGISKFNPTGTTLIYSTYIGGSSQDQPHSMVTDNNGVLYFSGRTYSNNYPVSTGGGHNGKSDIIVTKLNANGTLGDSRFMGGSEHDGVNISSQYGVVAGLKHSYADDARSEILLDNSGNVYVASCTKSNNFPTVNATKSSLGGLQDGVAFKLSNNLINVLWSTYIGGSDADAAYVLAFNKSQTSVYISGGTSSADFTGTGGLWNSYQGGPADGYIQKYENTGSYTLQRATLIGRGQYDQCFGIQVDDDDNVYVNGQTLGGTFPVTAGVYSNPNSSQFLMKLNGDLNTNVYSTVYGSGVSTTTNITPVAFLVDTCQNVYISGWGGQTSQNGGTTNGMPVNLLATTPSGIVSSTTTGNDFYFIVFSKNAASLLFAAFYGGSTRGEHVDGGTSRFDKNGVVYQAMCGGCNGTATPPVTPGVYSATKGSSNCNLLALKIAFNLGSVSAQAAAVPNAIVCLGDAVNFSSGGSANATSFEWDFGDGNASSSATPSHTYTAGGTFQVRMIAVNPNACKTRDTTFLTVRVDSNAMDADFDMVTTDSCKPFKAAITNTSDPGTAPGATTYDWDYGDGNTFTGFNPGTHEYPDTGSYNIRLIMTNPNACNSPDTISKTITFNTVYVVSNFGAPEKLCEKTEVVLNDLSTNGTTYLWDFGDGNTSTDRNPIHIYDTAGTYTIKLVTYNPQTCNRADSSEKTIFIEGTPVAIFRHSPIIPVTNDPIVFTNQSRDAINYVWDFGDDTYSQLETPEPKFYKKTGSYRVCLQASNLIGCSDTICRYVDADVYPLADLPKAFSPNGDGSNDILYVRGAGIESIDLKVFNRWGEIVFETTDIDIGWDGKYNGKEQPVEAYAYVLNVTFVDATTFNKRGNVTLLR